MKSLSLPEAFRQLLTPFCEVLTPNTARHLVALVLGWVLCQGRHTISRVIQAAGLTESFSNLYRFFSRARWEPDTFSRLLVQALIPHLPDDLEVIIDDTLGHHSGPHLFGASMHYDAPASTYGKMSKTIRRVAMACGHNWVVLALWLPLPFDKGQGVAIPVAFRLYRAAKYTPKSQFKKRTELASDLLTLLRSWLPDHLHLWVVVDQEYCCRQVMRNLPDNTDLIGPLPMDAALFEPKQTQRPGQSIRGRPRKKGPRLPNPEHLADEPDFPWHKHTVHIYGKDVSILVKTFTCLWYHVLGARPVRCLITRDPTGRIDDRAYCSTDPNIDLESMMVRFSHRWTLEVAFRNAKQFLGAEDPQNGFWRRPRGMPRPKKKAGPNPHPTRGSLAVRRTFPFVFLVHALLWLWYLQHGKPQQDVEAHRRAAPWYRHKHTPSFADVLTALRKQIFEEFFSAQPGLKGVRQKLTELLRPLLTPA